MDHTAARERPRSFRVHQYLPYLAHQAGYQRLQTTFGSKIYGVEPTWDIFVDAVKEEYYFLGNYEDQYMR